MQSVVALVLTFALAVTAAPNGYQHQTPQHMGMSVNQHESPQTYSGGPMVMTSQQAGPIHSQYGVTNEEAMNYGSMGVGPSTKSKGRIVFTSIEPAARVWEEHTVIGTVGGDDYQQKTGGQMMGVNTYGAHENNNKYSGVQKNVGVYQQQPHMNTGYGVNHQVPSMGGYSGVEHGGKSMGYNSGVEHSGKSMGYSSGQGVSHHQSGVQQMGVY